MQIRIGQLVLDGAAALPDVLLQYGHRAVQVQQEVGLGEVGIEHREEPLKEAKLLFVEVISSEQQGFEEEIVGDGDTSEQVRAGEVLRKLFVSLGHEEQLDGESVSLGIFVKVGEERVVGELL